jgi:hypothetical protein
MPKDLWIISLKLNNTKILSCSGHTMQGTLYSFIAITFSKGLFCERDFYRLGRSFAEKLFK